MWRRTALYGALLGAGTLALQLLDYQRLARTHLANLYVFFVAAGFLVLGVVLGMRLLRPVVTPPFDGNPAAQAALGLSARELEVLRALADGLSTKEIALALHISPNTVKTHVARLFEKLEARRRTEAIGKARALGLIR